MEVREPSARYVRATHQTDVGELPADWSCSSLGEVADILTGFPFPSDGYSASGVRLLRGSNVKRDQIEWRDDLTMYWPEVTGEIRKYALKAGDVVIAMDGSLVGRSFGALSKHDVPALLLQRVARVRSSEVDVSYLKHWICSERFTAHSDAVKTTTAIPHISPGDIRSFKVALPPTTTEQQQIGQALTDADALIDSLEQLLTKKRQIKQGAMQELLTGQRRLPGFDQPWISRRFAEVASVSRERVNPSALSDPPLCIELEHLQPGTGRLSGDAFKSQQAATKSVFRQGDVLFGKLRAYLRKYWLAEFDGVCSTEIWVMRPRGELASSAYLFYTVQRDDFIEAASTAYGTHMPRSDWKVVSEFDLSLPRDWREQAAIATTLSDMDAEITALESRLSKARSLKQAMAQALLTGRIRIPLPPQEPAA